MDLCKKTVIWRNKKMKKQTILFLIAFAILSCDKNSAVVRSGAALGQAEVTAAAGSLSVSVETQGRWNVRIAEGSEWVRTDVEGGAGNAAFTLFYDDNVTIPGDIRRSRRACVVVATKEYGRADTLYLVQHGILPLDFPKVTPAAGPVKVEFEQAPMKTLRILYASADGVDADAVKNWGVSQGYDLIACGNRFLHPAETGGVGLYAITDFSGIRFLTIDLASVAENDRPAAFRQILDENYTPASPSGDWILGGQLYHLSMMQTAWPDTPAWYPADALDSAFDSDRYAWHLNFQDCVWLSSQHWFSTWTSAGGQSWEADYVYVSKSVLPKLSRARLLEKPLAQMEHSPLEIVLNY